MLYYTCKIVSNKKGFFYLVRAWNYNSTKKLTDTNNK